MAEALPTDATAANGAVLITGCSDGGIGSSLAKEFQSRGFHVFATARTITKMAALEGISNITLLELDVTSATSINAAVVVVSEKASGKLNYLVNNAGWSQTLPILDTDIEKAKSMYDVNVWGMLAMTKAFASLVIAAKGSIVNIGSTTGRAYIPYLGE